MFRVSLLANPYFFSPGTKMNSKAPTFSLIGTFFLLSQLFAPVCAEDLDKGWPQWRGPQYNGVSTSNKPPLSWSESENVRWKVEVPGIGISTPIVLGDRIYVSTAVKTDRTNQPTDSPNAQKTDPSVQESQQQQEESSRAGGGNNRQRGGRRGRGRRRTPAPTNFYAFEMVAFDRQTGKQIWRTNLTEQVPHEAGHRTNTFASSSPVTDGERLYVSFGSRGVFAVDLTGKVLWEKTLGKMQTRAQFGEGSSPAVADDVLVVPFDHEGDSFIVGLDAKSGDEKWRQPRDEATTWSTPLITSFEGRNQVITNGSKRVRSYDLKTGELIWECGGQAGNPVPTPVRYKDNVIVMTGYRGYAIYSIPLSSKGDVTDQEIISWSTKDAAPYVPSPVLYDGQLYFLKSNDGILLSRAAENGELLIKASRVPDIKNIYASPVAAADHIFITGRDGTTVVIKHAKELEVVATNKLDAETDASAVIVDNEIYLRGKKHLYCISEQ